MRKKPSCAAIQGGSYGPDTAYYLAKVFSKRGGHTKDAINLKVR